MMKAIYKYPLLGEKTKLQIQGFLSILHIGEQDGRLYLWALVDFNQTHTYELKIKAIATGQKIYDILITENNYLKTVQMDNGLVFHFFEL